MSRRAPSRLKTGRDASEISSPLVVALSALTRLGEALTHLANERRVADARVMQALDHMFPWLLPPLRKVHEVGERDLVGERRGGRELIVLR
jgi:GAF domain-containing protein